MTEDIFSWDSMNAGADPFAEKSNRFETDDRFYTLTKDKDGKGAAVIRFLPDGEKRENGSMGTIQKVFKINTTFTKNGKKRFVNEYSPTTIGLPDPFQEEWSRLYNAGDKEASKAFNRTTRYITNIKVIKDPACPENEGKIFLFDMSYTMAQKIQGYIQPSEADLALGTKPKALFNPINGYNFKLIAKMGANDMITYDSSTIDDAPSAIYKDAQEAIDDISKNAHKLSWFLDESNYLSYDKLKEKLDWVCWKDSNNSGSSSKPEVKVETAATPASAASTAQTVETPNNLKNDAPFEPDNSTSVEDELDALINGITK